MADKAGSDWASSGEEVAEFGKDLYSFLVPFLVTNCVDFRSAVL